MNYYRKIEKKANLENKKTYDKFNKQIISHKNKLVKIIKELNKK